MRDLTRALPVSLILGALGTLVLALPMSADAHVFGCEVSGTAGTDEVPLVGRSALGATYLFSTGAGAGAPMQCIVDGGEPMLASLTSSGTYQNVVCGTGTADSSSNLLVASDTGFESAFDSSQYHIVFAGGQGVLTFSGAITGGGAISITANGDDQGNQTPGSAAAADVTGTGVQPGGRNDCTNHFVVTGSVTGQYT